MATTPTITRHIDVTLREVEAEVAFLPDLAKQWGDEPAISKDSWFLEWSELFNRFGGLRRDHKTGVMTESQRQRYERLVSELRERAPLFERLDLPLPPAWIWDDRHKTDEV